MGFSHCCSSKPDITNVCICEGLKQTVNAVLTLDKCPIPKVEDLLSTLAGGKIFSKIEFSHAYQRLPLADESKQYVIILLKKTCLIIRTCLPFRKTFGYASRSLSKAEKNYSQIEKEGHACVFGVSKFHSYLHGHSFELITDHKPLRTLFHQHT